MEGFPALPCYQAVATRQRRKRSTIWVAAVQIWEVLNRIVHSAETSRNPAA